MNVVPIHHDEVIVKRDRLAALERTERAHDAYMRATEKMRSRQVAILDAVEAGKGTPRHDGWLDAMREFAEAVVLA